MTVPVSVKESPAITELLVELTVVVVAVRLAALTVMETALEVLVAYVVEPA
jgi:hypothetical protein